MYCSYFMLLQVLEHKGWLLMITSAENAVPFFSLSSFKDTTTPSVHTLHHSQPQSFLNEDLGAGGGSKLSKRTKYVLKHGLQS